MNECLKHPGVKFHEKEIGRGKIMKYCPHCHGEKTSSLDKIMPPTRPQDWLKMFP